jgi:hypothetical protein
LLEIDVLREKERADRLQDALTTEQRDKDKAMSSLRVEREGASSKKMASDRDRAQLTTSLKITQETLEVLRKENDELRKGAAARCVMRAKERERERRGAS